LNNGRINDRIVAAVDRLRVRPDGFILEVGCGHGFAVDLICQRLVTGKVVAIDRSSKMISAAVRRNAEHITSGRAEFHVCDLEDFDPAGRQFDAILALRVRLFHRDPTKARHLIAAYLKPGGRIVAEYDEP
jgi:ubiquinone/menaquinone biosynthesis C-methylase UbiE